MGVYDMPHCEMWWIGEEVDPDHVCMRAPSFHKRHVCECGAEMIED